jgi:hypothetical protein
MEKARDRYREELRYLMAVSPSSSVFRLADKPTFEFATFKEAVRYNILLHLHLRYS